jgi:hypothetical protein
MTALSGHEMNVSPPEQAVPAGLDQVVLPLHHFEVDEPVVDEEADRLLEHLVERLRPAEVVADLLEVLADPPPHLADQHAHRARVVQRQRAAEAVHIGLVERATEVRRTVRLHRRPLARRRQRRLERSHARAELTDLLRVPGCSSLGGSRIRHHVPP